MSSPDFASVQPKYHDLWVRSEILPERLPSVTKAARLVLANKERYQSVEQRTGVPWYLVGCLHLREADCNFHCHLHNGDPLTARTYHVPAGRPLNGNPPFTWEESAQDALTMRGLPLVHGWTIERVAYEAEGYNGWGYYFKGRLSPYDWSGDTLDGSHEEATGKYIRDHVFDPSVIDRQPGVMAVLKVMTQLDPSILGHAGAPTPKVGVYPPEGAPSAQKSTSPIQPYPVPQKNAPGSNLEAPKQSPWAALGSLLSSLIHALSAHS